MKARRLWAATALMAVLAIAGCGSDDEGASGGSAGGQEVTAESWTPEFSGDKLQPLPDGFPSGRLTILNSDDAGSSDGLYARVMQKALNQVSPVRVQVVDRPQQEWGRWTNLQSVQREPDGEDGHTQLVFSMVGVGLDFLTAPVTEETGLTVEDMNPVIATEQVPFVLIAPDDAPFDTYEELVAEAKERPGELKYLALGTGSQLDIAMERLMAEGGYEADKVPLTNPVEITTAIAAGEGDFAMMLPDVALGQYEAGRIKVLLAVGDTAPEPWTDATTTADLGLEEPWGSLRGVVVPPGVPELHRRWLEEAYRAASKTDEYRQRIEETPGAKLIDLGHDELVPMIRRSLELAEPIIRDLGLHHSQQ